MSATIIRLPTAAPRDPVTEIHNARIKEWSETDKLITELQSYCAAHGLLIQCANLSELRGDVRKRIKKLTGE